MSGDLPTGKHALLICLEGKSDPAGYEKAWKFDRDLYMPFTQKNLSRVFEVYDHMAVIRIMDMARLNEGRYILGTWKCEQSPYGVCLYDHKKDSAHDHCMVCEKPDERK